MHTDRGAAAVARTPIQIQLTAAGWVVAAMLPLGVALAGPTRLAIGFFVPVIAAVVIDLYLSWFELGRREVIVTPTRTAAHLPAGIPTRISAAGPNERPLRVVASVATGEGHVVGLGSGVATAELTSATTGSTDVVSLVISCTMFGLASARRWEIHRVPMLHWAPAPDSTRLVTPEGLDEVSRLRAYVPGDRVSRIAWPVTARTGQLHVRTPGDGQDEFVVVVNLDGSPGADAPERDPIRLASTLVSQLLEDGHRVRLVTNQITARHADAWREQAMRSPRATLAPMAVPHALLDVDGVIEVVDDFVHDETDATRRLASATPGPRLAPTTNSWVDVSSAGIRTLP